MAKKESYYKFTWQAIVKQQIPQVTFVSFLKDAEVYCLRVIFKNSTGGRDTLDYKLNVLPQEMESKEWEFIIANVKRRVEDDKSNV